MLACLVAVSGAAFAVEDGAIDLPEPGVLELAAVGGIAAVIAKLARCYT